MAAKGQIPALKVPVQFDLTHTILPHGSETNPVLIQFLQFRYGIAPLRMEATGDSTAHCSAFDRVFELPHSDIALAKAK